jgi:hypothetical protein
MAHWGLLRQKQTNKEHSPVWCAVCNRRVKHNVPHSPFFREYAEHFYTENFPLELASHESVIRN